MDEAGFDIFGESDDGRPGNIEEVMELIRHSINEHGMTFEDAVGVLVDLVRPGNSENSHDVKPMFMGAMFAFGFGDLAHKFGSLYLNSMPWGIGFSIAVEHGLHFNDLPTGAQNAIVQSLCVVLQIGGLSARVEDGHIILTSPEGDESTVDVDSIVGQFREQMDKELGPDGPEPDDPMRRWMP
jgi:hypothetical protein